MSQYERIVSYIYQYIRGEKGANVGYVRMEKRGNQCRLSIQMRSMPLQEPPKVYLYQQLSEGIQTICAGTMVLHGGNLLWKGTCDADKLFGTNQRIENMDGIYIDGTDNMYFASSWGKEYFNRGIWNKDAAFIVSTEPGKPLVGIWEAAAEEAEPSKASVQSGTTPLSANKAEKEEQVTEAAVSQEAPAPEKSEEEVTVVAAVVEGENSAARKTEKKPENIMLQKPERQVPPPTQRRQENASEKQAFAKEAGDIQMQSICGVCPFKRKMYDYGKKILMTFPSMRPFENGVTKACVRMELQDIGCLPIASWSLSGNRFLLHGYYCYRHLLFAQLIDGRYVLGVPGIFSEKERRNAIKFGFSDFQSIGDFGMKQGAFGYWFLELPKGNEVMINA